MPARLKLPRRANAIVLIGAGRMGLALLKGWVAAGIAPIIVVEPAPSPDLRRLARAKGIKVCAAIEGVDAAHTGICVVAIKPQILRSEAARLRAFSDAGALIVSIAAGTSTRTLGRACGRTARLIRAMPNLPGAIGRGISGLYAAGRATAADRANAEALLASLGQTVWVARETLIDSVTAVSGSGPAYVFLLAEVLARAGEREGLPRALAVQLARATIAGAGALLDADPRAAEALRHDVTSPGGTTEAALAVLMRDEALATLVEEAVTAARRRAEILSG